MLKMSSADREIGSEDAPRAFFGRSRHLDLDAGRAGAECGGGDRHKALA
jgi:hypothetical protein